MMYGVATFSIRFTKLRFLPLCFMPIEFAFESTGSMSEPRFGRAEPFCVRFRCNVAGGGCDGGGGVAGDGLKGRLVFITRMIGIFV
jgi:hypothetical protein